MEAPEIRGIVAPGCLSHFAQGITPTYDYLYGGLFWSKDEPYMDNLAILVQQLLKKDKSEPIINLYEKFNKILSDPKYTMEGKALYKRSDVVWNKPWQKTQKELIFDRYKKDKWFRLLSGELTQSAVEQKAGLIFVRLLGIEGGIIDRQKVWEGRKKVLELWEAHNKNPEVKAYLTQVRKLIGLLESCLSPNALKKSPSLLKLIGYLIPVMFKDFEGLLLISRAALFERRTQAMALLEDIKEKDKILWEDIKYVLQKEGLSEKNLYELIQRLENEEFLTELRRDWKPFLQAAVEGKVEGLKGAFLHTSHKEATHQEAQISFGSFHAPGHKLTVYVFYEDSLKGLEKEFCKKFREIVKEKSLNKYIGYPEIELYEETYSLSRLIYELDTLKEMDFGSPGLKAKDSTKLVFSLLNFACRLRRFQASASQKDSLLACLFLLDTDVREENGSYPFWDYFSFIYEFFGLPVQTINRQTINKIIQSSDITQLRSIYKNLFISLLKDQKKISFEYRGFNLPDKLTVYAILEKPSTAFCYKQGDKDQKPSRHFLYEIYTITIENAKSWVDIKDKEIVLSEESEFQKDRLFRWMQEEAHKKDIRFCFITAGRWSESPLYEHIHNRATDSEKIRQKSIFLEYMSFPTAYISERSMEDCVVIYSSEFERLRQKLGLNTDRLSTAIAIKPADVKERFELPGEGQFYHSHLQVFSTEKPGWEREELYSQKKNLLLFSILALSLYESESFQTPYSKLDLWQRKRSIEITLKRAHGEYRMPLNAVLYEMLRFVSQVPAKSEPKKT